jgi:hypothetical protein
MWFCDTWWFCLLNNLLSSLGWWNDDGTTIGNSSSCSVEVKNLLITAVTNVISPEGGIFWGFWNEKNLYGYVHQWRSVDPPSRCWKNHGNYHKSAVNPYCFWVINHIQASFSLLIWCYENQVIHIHSYPLSHDYQMFLLSQYDTILIPVLSLLSNRNP